MNPPLQSGRSASAPHHPTTVVMAPRCVPAVKQIQTLSAGPDLRLSTKEPLVRKGRKVAWRQGLAAARETV